MIRRLKVALAGVLVSLFLTTLAGVTVADDWSIPCV